MFNPTKKGVLSFDNKVTLRGYENIGLLALACIISYGEQYASLFEKADLNQVLKGKNDLYWKGTETPVSFEDSYYEVYVSYLSQNEEARDKFEQMTDLSCTDKKLESVLMRIKAEGLKPVPELEQALTEAEVVSEVEASTEKMVEASTEETPTEEVKEVTTEEVEAPTEVEATAEETPTVTEEVRTPTEEVQELLVEEVEETLTEEASVEEIEASDAPTAEVEDSTVSTVEETSVDSVEQFESVEESSMAEEVNSTPVIEVLQKSREESSTEVEDGDYLSLISGKLTNEIENFKLIPNSNTAEALLKKLQGLLPEMSVINMVYNKQVLHALLIEFKGAASMLSSFRVLALGLSTRS